MFWTADIRDASVAVRRPRFRHLEKKVMMKDGLNKTLWQKPRRPVPGSCPEAEARTGGDAVSDRHENHRTSTTEMGNEKCCSACWGFTLMPSKGINCMSTITVEFGCQAKCAQVRGHESWGHFCEIHGREGSEAFMRRQRMSTRNQKLKTGEVQYATVTSDGCATYVPKCFFELRVNLTPQEYGR